MGDSPANSVTDADARFHNIANAYAVGPAVQPTIGSPNPMLTGVALAHRLADHLVPVAATLGEGPRTLFNGVDSDHDGSVTLAEAREKAGKRWRGLKASQGN